MSIRSKGRGGEGSVAGELISKNITEKSRLHQEKEKLRTELETLRSDFRRMAEE